MHKKSFYIYKRLQEISSYANLSKANFEFRYHPTLLKEVSDFPAPSRDVTNQTLPARE